VPPRGAVAFGRGAGGGSQSGSERELAEGLDSRGKARERANAQTEAGCCGKRGLASSPFAVHRARGGGGERGEGTNPRLASGLAALVVELDGDLCRRPFVT